MVPAPGCGLDARDLAHDRRLLLTLFGLLGVQRVVPLFCIRVVLHYLSGLPLSETQLVLVLDGTSDLLLLLLEHNCWGRFVKIMLFGSGLGGTSQCIQRLDGGVQGLLILGMARVLPLEVRFLFLFLESLNLFPHGIRVQYLLINGIQLLSIGLLDLLGLPARCGGRLELGVHDLQGVTHHVIGFGEGAEGGEDLVVDALGQQDLVEGVLETVARVLIFQKCSGRVMLILVLTPAPPL